MAKQGNSSRRDASGRSGSASSAVLEPGTAKQEAGDQPFGNQPQFAGSAARKTANGEKNLAIRYGIDEESLGWRRHFVRLSDDDRALMEELIPWAHSVASEIASEFFDWQFTFQPTHRYFENLSRERAIPLTALRKDLESAQSGHFIQMFEGARSNWGLDYFEKRLQAGKLYDTINLPMKWCLGSYVEYEVLAEKILRKSLKDEAKISRVRSTLQKIFNLDMQAVVDSFVLSGMETAGADVDLIRTNGDKSDHLLEVKQNLVAVRHQLETVEEFGKGNFDAPLEALPGKRSFINDMIEPLRTNLKALITDTEMLAKAVTDGNLGLRVDVSKHPGDFRRIVEGINKVLDTVVEPLRTTGQNAATLASSSEELTAVSQQMAGNAEETAMQANVVSAASEQVSKNVSSVAAASEEMQVSIREISKNANDSARVAKNAVNAAMATNETVKKLGESSQEIGKVVKVITSIAQQTNLLALNATIEAARAGEAGKGFAVVANEVKELAKQTAKATEEISYKIVVIQDNTNGAVKAIEEIGNIINQINDISNSIASAVEEQTVTTNEIGRSVAEAAKGVEEIAKNIGGVAVAAKNTTMGANDTQKASQELSQMATRLQMTVSKFTF